MGKNRRGVHFAVDIFRLNLRQVKVRSATTACTVDTSRTELEGSIFKVRGKVLFLYMCLQEQVVKGASLRLSQPLSSFSPFTFSPYLHHHNRQLDPIYLLLSDVLDRFSAFSAQFWVEPTFWVVALLPCCPVMMAPHSSCPSRYPPVKTGAVHHKGCSSLVETDTSGNQTLEGFLDHSSFI